MNLAFEIKKILTDSKKPISDYVLIHEYSEKNNFSKQETIDFVNEYACCDYPIQYIVGFEYFFNKKVFVDKRVLIPRMETEEVVLELVKKVKLMYKKKSKICILDMCTGSGAIVVALKELLIDFDITFFASDISGDALRVAEKNFSFHNIDVNLVKSDLFESIDEKIKFDIIIANPPYLDDTDIITSSVLKYEPSIALFANVDKKNIFERIFLNIHKYTNERFILCFEIGPSQTEKLINIINTNLKYDIIKDMNGFDRIFIASKGIMIVDEKEIVKSLLNGEVVGIPTDTVYGFAVLKEYEYKLYDLKNRQSNKKLINFLFDINQIPVTDELSKEEIAVVASKYWPGNNTLIFKIDNELISFRIPNEENVLSMLKKINCLVLTTSANMSGEEPCLTSEQFITKFPNIKLLEEVRVGKKTNIPSNIYIICKNKETKIR